MAWIARELARPHGPTDRRLRAEPRPGRQPRRRRPPRARAAPRGRRSSSSRRYAAPLPGRGVRRVASVPVLHRPHRPVHRGRHARGAPARVRRFRGASRPPTCPTRRRLRRSSARSSKLGLRIPSLRVCSAFGASFRASSTSRSTRPSAGSSCAVVARASRSTFARSRWSSERETLARQPLPPRAAVGRRRYELLALLRARDEGRALPVRRGRSRAALRAHRAHGVQLARLLPGHRSRPALRLPRVRPLGAGAGSPLQPGQAPHRPLRQGNRGADPLGPGEHAAVRGG